MTEQDYVHQLGKLLHIQARIDQAIILLDELGNYESLMSEVDRKRAIDYEERLLGLQEQLQEIFALELVSLSPLRKRLNR
jgi:hypothetical protein